MGVIKFKPGTFVSDYEIVREISNGGFAVAYEAKDKYGQRVFFKNYKSPSPLVPWFKGYVAHQGELKRRIQGDPALKDRCYRFIEFFVHGPSYCQVFEFIDSGMSLEGLLARREEFSWEQIVTFAKVMMFAIKYLHNVKIVHTDLKPENIMLIPDHEVGIGYRLRLVDMDWSIFSDRKAPWDGEQGYIGTAGYQSPEHLRSEVPQEASDIFTCGIMLSQLIGKGHPYAETDELIDAVLNERFQPFQLADKLPKVEDHEFVEQVINACFSADPAKRPTAAQLADALSGKVFPWGSHVKPSKSGSDVHYADKPSVHATSAAMHPSKVEVLLNGEKVTTIGIDSKIGKTNFRNNAHAVDAQFMSDPQFEITRHDGQWKISHCQNAVNETIVNGKKLEGMLPVEDGMVVSVGNSEKGIEKLPLELKLA